MRGPRVVVARAWSNTLGRFWSWFWLVAKPYFTSEMRGQAFRLLAIPIVLLLGLTGLNVVNSYVGQHFMTAITKNEPSRYYWFALFYLVVFAASTVVGALSRYVELLLGLRWREWLTRRFIHCYVGEHGYTQAHADQEIDNPDQRISQDINTFTTTSLSFLIILFNSVVTILAFSSILWSITPWLFVVAVLYPALGTTLAVLIGRRLVNLNNLQLRKEADLRYELVHARDSADDVTRDHREDAVVGVLQERLQAVIKNYREIITILRNLKFFSGGYNYLTQLIPVLIVAPMYMNGEVAFGVVTQSMMAFSQVFNAFSLVVEQFQDISEFTAVIKRLASLAHSLAWLGAAPPTNQPAAMKETPQATASGS